MSKLKLIINIIFLFSTLSSIVIIPFSTYSPLLSKDKNVLSLIKNCSDKDIVDILLKNLIYINLNLGSNNFNNSQNATVFIEMTKNEFILKSLDPIDNNDYSLSLFRNTNYSFNNNTILKKIINLKYYNSSLSDSYKLISSPIEDEFSYDTKGYSTENFYFNYKNNSQNEIKKINIGFTYLEAINSDNRPGILGMSLDIAKGYDFLIQLKENNLINIYDWTLKYTDLINEKGDFIIGELPHLYDEKNYLEKNLRIMTNNNYKGSKIWNLFFNKIFIDDIKNGDKELFKEEDNLSENIGIFNIEEFFISGTKEYYNYIQENYFNKFISENTCKKITQSLNNVQYYYFMCYFNGNKKKLEEFTNNFPKLIFYQNEINFNFTLNSNDLFTIIPDDNRVLFNVKFSFSDNKWIFGKSFFKKYQFIFDSESKLIKYYIQEEKKENVINDYHIYLKIVIIALLIIIIFAIGVFFGKKIFNKLRKKRANELDDDYNYIQDNNIKENENNNNNIDSIGI